MIDIVNRHLACTILGQCRLADNAITINREVLGLIVENDSSRSHVAFDGDVGLTGIIVERHSTAWNEDGRLSVCSDKISRLVGIPIESVSTRPCQVSGFIALNGQHQLAVCVAE